MRTTRAIAMLEICQTDRYTCGVGGMSRLTVRVSRTTPMIVAHGAFDAGPPDRMRLPIGS